MTPHPQEEAHALSLSDPQAFWFQAAAQLTWERAPRTILSRADRKAPGSNHTYPGWSWLPDGRLSTTYNCIDRHVSAGRGSQPAIIYDSPVTGTKATISYTELQEQVATLAGVLREECKVQCGDVVLIYMPMIPAALIGILAVAQLGAVHAVVFGGFGSNALAQRIDACRPKVVLTASCGVEGAKGVIGYRKLVRGAVELSKHKPPRTLIWQRNEGRWDPVAERDGERDWKALVIRAKTRGLKAGPVATSATDPLYIIYTSGTTGSPKGVVRQVGGHAVGLSHSIRFLFGMRPGDVMFCASDVGWVVGHSYILYAPLLAGATTVLFEGKPIGTPDAGTFWRVVEEYRVNVMFTAPTALRAIRKEDPHAKFLSDRGARGGLKSLRALFLAGERSEPAIVTLYQDLLDRYCAPNASVVDNYWSSESGSPITGLAQLPATGLDPAALSRIAPHTTRPGSAGKPLPGFDVRVVSDTGEPLSPGEMGNIVLAPPLAPTAFTTLFNDASRFYKSYFLRFYGRWFDTGDAGIIDADGYVHVMSRSDDIINVAAHRLSTGAIEQVIASHPDVVEACVVPIPDALKGHVPFAFAASNAPRFTGKEANKAERELLAQLNLRVRSQIGPIAALGGLIVAQGVIPKTRSGKTLRRVLRQLLEDASEGRFDAEVNVPATVEDMGVVENARKVVRKYFERESKSGEKAKL